MIPWGQMNINTDVLTKIPPWYRFENKLSSLREEKETKDG
jgi:hypothetical protein